MEDEKEERRLLLEQEIIRKRQEEEMQRERGEISFPKEDNINREDSIPIRNKNFNQRAAAVDNFESTSNQVSKERTTNALLNKNLFDPAPIISNTIRPISSSSNQSNHSNHPDDVFIPSRPATQPPSSPPTSARSVFKQREYTRVVEEAKIAKNEAEIAKKGFDIYIYIYKIIMNETSFNFVL